MKKLIIFSFIICVSIIKLSAQQDAEYSMYMFNGMYVNPAYTGSQECVSITALYRHQWVGIKGAPRSGTIAVNAPLKKDQYALGGMLNFDMLGLDKTVSGYIDYAYRLRFKNGTKLSLGIQAGGMYYHSSLTDAKLPIDPNDISFSADRNLFLPNVGFGAYLYSKKYYVGVSVPHILNMSLSKNWSTVTDRATLSKLYNHYIFTAGGVIGKEDAKVKFKPSTLVKVTKNAPVSIDVTGSFLFINRIWLGASYRFGVGKKDLGNSNLRGNRIVALTEFKLTPQLRIGYAYDYEFDNLHGYQKGSHEVMLGYNFGSDRTRFVTPRYVTYF
ncbi:MAG: type IX secretion system membrane protein PorP/SprF [Bacteroidota bacterium]